MLCSTRGVPKPMPVAKLVVDTSSEFGKLCAAGPLPTSPIPASGRFCVAAFIPFCGTLADLYVSYIAGDVALASWPQPAKEKRHCDKSYPALYQLLPVTISKKAIATPESVVRCRSERPAPPRSPPNPVAIVVRCRSMPDENLGPPNSRVFDGRRFNGRPSECPYSQSRQSGT